MTLLRVLFFLLPAVAWAQPAAAPAPASPPPKPIIDRAEAFIRSDPAMVDAIIRSAAASMAGQTQQSPPHTSSTPAPAMAVQPPAPVPVAAVSPVVMGLSVPPEIVIALWTLVGTIILAATGAVTAWIKSHTETVQHNKIIEQVGANEAINNAQKTQGALVELSLAKQGRSLSGVDVSDPVVQSSAQTLRASFPEWGQMVGLTQDIAARKVLGSAIEQSAVPLVPAAAVAVVQTSPAPEAFVAAAATPQQPSHPAQGSIA